MVPYTFHAKSKRLAPISTPNLGNNDSRFWEVKTKVLVRCKAPQIRIMYDAGSACDSGDDLIGNFTYEKSDEKWIFVGDK